uniref:Putative histone H3 n=1 Tax=Xenopsylla cheopis TaxID=163159 RepID=A0A6M2DFU7_XENCH
MARRKSTPSKKETSASVVVHKRRRRKNVWLKEVKRLQRSTNLLIPKLPFSRVVKEIIQYMRPNSRDIPNVTAKCLEALHEATELFMTQFFQDAYCCTLHRNRVTLMPVDFSLCRRLRGPCDVSNY